MDKTSFGGKKGNKERVSEIHKMHIVNSDVTCIYRLMKKEKGVKAY